MTNHNWVFSIVKPILNHNSIQQSILRVRMTTKMLWFTADIDCWTVWKKIDLDTKNSILVKRINIFIVQKGVFWISGLTKCCLILRFGNNQLFINSILQQLMVLVFFIFAFSMQITTFTQHGSKLEMTKKYLQVENYKNHVKIQNKGHFLVWIPSSEVQLATRINHLVMDWQMDRWTDGRTAGQTNGQKEFLPILKDLDPKRSCCLTQTSKHQISCQKVLWSQRFPCPASFMLWSLRG